jgi:hypothetical protein
MTTIVKLLGMAWDLAEAALAGDEAEAEETAHRGIDAMRDKVAALKAKRKARREETDAIRSGGADGVITSATKVDRGDVPGSSER